MTNLVVLHGAICTDCKVFSQKIRRGLCEWCALVDTVEALRLDVESQPHRTACDA